MAMRVDWCVSSCGFVSRILTHSQPDAVIPCQERENYSSRGAQLSPARPPSPVPPPAGWNLSYSYTQESVLPRIRILDLQGGDSVLLPGIALPSP